MNTLRSMPTKPVNGEAGCMMAAQMGTMASASPVVASTHALRRALAEMAALRGIEDWLFLERWERAPAMGAATALRVNQIRRANPALAAEIRAEITRGRPLTEEERAALLRWKNPPC